jgi:hypothetical protein
LLRSGLLLPVVFLECLDEPIHDDLEHRALPAATSTHSGTLTSDPPHRIAACRPILPPANVR